MVNKAKPITKCRSCNSRSLIYVLSLGSLALSDFVNEDSKIQKYPLNLVLCNNCYLVQLKHTVLKSLLYTERYGYKSGTNNTMRNELKEIVRKAQRKINVTCNLLAVDVGANDGTLLNNYPDNVFKVGIEPIKKLAKECKEKTDIVINDFFRYESYSKKMKNRKADIITAISCFYDIEDPNLFLSDVKKILDENGVLVIQQNYLGGMLRQNAYDNIVHEHLEYYSLLSLENLLSKYGLEVIDVELSSVNGGSFRTFVSYKNKKPICDSVQKIRAYEKKLKLNKMEIYKNFAKRIKDNKEILNKFIKDLVKENKKVYVYGASTRGNTLLQYCGLDNHLVKAAVERQSEKWGKKIASVGIPIISEEQARKDKPDYMLVLPWFFKDEFLKREKKYLESGGHFIFPLPELEVI